ncbi:alpha/beta fold hydrolase [bacterium]|nr:alpha/beta fold hydrolase [bacterium]
MHKILTIALLFIAMISVADATDKPHLTFKTYEFESDDGKQMPAELGELIVPENRNGKSSRVITLRFVKFASTAKGQRSPIVYLAGGPGGSGIDAARGSRFPLFMAMREFGDVIAFDQRGTGMSEPDISCKETYLVPLNEPLDRAVAGKILADSARACFQRLQEQGIDLSSYNTRENAADLNDLRIALKSPRLTLWGISYGTHLSLAAMKYHGDFIDRVILAGLEPLHHTYKLPADQQKLLATIAELATKDPKVAASVPDLMSSLQQLLKTLEHEPQVVSLTHPQNGMTAQIKVGKFDLQYALAGMLVGPETFAGMPDFISRLEKSDWTALALLTAQNRMGEAPNAMSIAMDCSSGANREWSQEIAQQAKNAMLGDAINFPFPEICPSDLDLGDDFRKPVTSNIPALLISGTLDGRTPPSNAEAVAAHLKNSQHLVIEGAGHSDPLFLSSPDILAAIKTFMRGKPLREKRITVPIDPFISPRKIVQVPDEILDRYVGTYKINEKESRRVLKAGNILYTQRGDGPARPVRPMSQTEFFYEGIQGWLRFDLNPEGKVTGMTVFQGRRTPGEPAVRIEKPTIIKGK